MGYHWRCPICQQLFSREPDVGMITNAFRLEQAHQDAKTQLQWDAINHSMVRCSETTMINLNSRGPPICPRYEQCLAEDNSTLQDCIFCSSTGYAQCPQYSSSEHVMNVSVGMSDIGPHIKHGVLRGGFGKEYHSSKPKVNPDE